MATPAARPKARRPDAPQKSPAGHRRLAHSPLPGPDPALFLSEGSGHWRLRLGAFVADPSGLPAGAHLRALVEGNMDALKIPGGVVAVDSVPDDLLLAAAAAGAVSSVAFLDIVDGGDFALAPCLCCYATGTAAKAREVGASLTTFLKYYDVGSFIASRAYPRAVATLSRDLLASEANEIREFVSRLDSTPDTVRSLNGAGGLCVALPPCRPGVVWVYSTPEGRRLLRHLARDLRKDAQVPVRVTVESSDPTVFPRFRYRMYSISFARPVSTPNTDSAASPVTDSATSPVTDRDLIIGAALAWVRAGGLQPAKS